MQYDQLAFESLCQSLEPLMFGEPGVNFTCRPEKGTLMLMVQKGQDVASVQVDRIALQNASTPEELSGVAREALTRLRGAWREQHREFETRPSHLDDAHSALWNRTRQTPDQSAANKGESVAVYPGPGRGHEPLVPSSKYDDGQVNAADLSQYHSLENAAGNVDPASPSSKYDDADRKHPRDTTTSESEHPKGATHNPKGTEGGRDGSASTDTVTGSVRNASKHPSAYPKSK